MIRKKTEADLEPWIADRAGERCHLDLALDRVEAIRAAGDLHRRSTRQSGAEMQINKSDRNDAIGIARIMQAGWYKEVRVKRLDSHAIKALLVKIKRDIENQIPERAS
jgi:hypothetical protein